MLMKEPKSVLVHLQVCGTDSMSGKQAWRYLEQLLIDRGAVRKVLWAAASGV